ncbi:MULTISPECIES: TetR/AcrR family transcriptional regulator [Nitrincola]|uniref:HTH-type transcriptional repressor nemR n=1 Tax=Nitrincola nitratireducens TaxID=1229521 RepID=W9VHZ9_9GAMM|nr:MULTISPECIES: TetR/AcrR family transcriptional regulator [Nitrincola]EXJ10230.1 HTH-type transcriptional repressor nemR [Nitrincola nitratireducens]
MNKGRPPTHCREHLLQCGIELFYKNGYHGTGLSLILKACGVSKGSFYNFFESKEAYAVEVIEYYEAIEHDRWQLEWSQLEGNHATRMRKMLEKTIEDFDETKENLGCLITNLSGEIGGESPEFRLAIKKATNKVLGFIEEDIRICQAEGSVRDDLPAATLATMIWHLWQGALLRMKVEGSKQPLRDTISLTWDYLLKPISVQKGYSV